MAKNQNTYEKRRREFEKRRKSAEKLARRQERNRQRDTITQPGVPHDESEEPAV